MGWEDIDIRAISLTPKILPAKSYTFQLLSGTEKNEKGAVTAAAAVLEEGEWNGYKLSMYFPDPYTLNKYNTTNDWSAMCMARLVNALGVDVPEREDTVSILTRASGHTFQASVYHTAATDEFPAQAKINLKSFKPAA